jgi:hypothetical protein
MLTTKSYDHLHTVTDINRMGTSGSIQGNRIIMLTLHTNIQEIICKEQLLVHCIERKVTE